MGRDVDRAIGSRATGGSIDETLNRSTVPQCRAPILESMGVVDGDCVAAGEYPGKAAPQEITWEADLTTCQRFRCRPPAVQPCTCLARRYPTQESFGGGVCEVWTQRLGSGGGLDLNDAWSEVIIEFDHRARHVIEKLVCNHQTCDAPVPSGDVLDVVGHAPGATGW